MEGSRKRSKESVPTLGKEKLEIRGGEAPQVLKKFEYFTDTRVGAKQLWRLPSNGDRTSNGIKGSFK
jgi:hypothetical protein